MLTDTNAFQMLPTLAIDSTASLTFSGRLAIPTSKKTVRDRSIAEEVASDTFLQVWRDASQYISARGSVMAWLCMIARSRALDALRRRAKLLAHELPSDDSVHELTISIEHEPRSI